MQDHHGLHQYHQPIDYRMPPPQLLHPEADNTFIYRTKVNVPKIVNFSGDEPPQKGYVSYKDWRFEINCLSNDPDITPNILIQTIRKFLRGTAHVIIHPR